MKFTVEAKLFYYSFAAGYINIIILLYSSVFCVRAAIAFLYTIWYKSSVWQHIWCTYFLLHFPWRVFLALIIVHIHKLKKLKQTE